MLFVNFGEIRITSKRLFYFLLGRNYRTALQQMSTPSQSHTDASNSPQFRYQPITVLFGTLSLGYALLNASQRAANDTDANYHFSDRLYVYIYFST
jgi:hypothetical protein